MRLLSSKGVLKLANYGAAQPQAGRLEVGRELPHDRLAAAEVD